MITNGLRKMRKDMLNLKITGKIVTLLLLILLVFYVNINVIGGSSIQNTKTLAFELSGDNMNLPPEQWINLWMWGEKAPFKYRILGKLLIWGTWKLTNTEDHAMAFYRTYVCWAFILMIAIICALYVYLRILFSNITKSPAYGDWLPFLGCVLFLSAPPILLAFKFPVHTHPNDLLGYFLIILGMIAILQAKSIMMCLISCIAVFCRETTLVVPFIYFLTSSASSRKKYVLSFLPCLVWGVYRKLWWEPYNPFPAVTHNFEYPCETYAFLFLAFGFLWVPGLLGYVEMRPRENPNNVWSVIIRSFPITFFLLLGISVFLARIREIRILFNLFVFFIPFSLYWIILNEDNIKTIVKTRSYWIWIGVALMITFMGRWFMHPIFEGDYMFFVRKFAHLYGGYGGGWVNILWLYIFALLAIIPLVFKYRKPDVIG
jgi:hypothetical protein